MTAAELWTAYAHQEALEDVPYQAWAFGGAPDELAKLVLSRIKTATASAYPVYALEHEPLPKMGDYSVVLDSHEEAVCIIQTTKVYVVPFHQVSAEHAFKEGEGDRSLGYWRAVHTDFFTQCMAEVGMTFDETMEVVCEEFVRVYP